MSSIAKYTKSWFKRFKVKQGTCFLCQTEFPKDAYDELKFRTLDGVITKKICRPCADKIHPEERGDGSISI